MFHRCGRLLATTATASLALGIAVPAIAQTAPSTEPVQVSTQADSPTPSDSGPQASPESGLEAGDIIVTAQKRSERLQDVPLAVTALSGDQLANSQVAGTSGIAALVPSLTFTQSTSDLNNNVRIRGVGTSLFNTGLESAVSFVVDGVVLSRQGQGFQDLIDVDRVEVLRGPQGTLFGKNATAGVINVVTKRPSKSLEGVAEATIAEMGEYRVRGSVSGPLTETLGARLTGYYTNDRGWLYDVGRGKHVNGNETFGLRGKVEWDPTANLNLLLTADYRKSDSDCCQPIPYQTTSPVLAALRAPVIASRENRTVASDQGTFSDTRQGGVSLEAGLDLGGPSLTSITAWRQWKFANNVDVDGFVAATPVYVPFGNGYFGINGGTVDIKQFTQELRLTSPSNVPVEYTVGLFYFHLDLDRDFTRRTGGCVTNPAAFGQPCPTFFFSSGSSASTGQTDNYAAFGQVQWHVTDQLSAIGGFRLQRETVSYAGSRNGLPSYTGDRALFAANTGRGSVSDTDLSGKAGLQYEFSRRAQVYGTWSRGYKGQGYDLELTANFASQPPVRPETVNAFEIGFKGQSPDGRFSLNAAAFHAKYNDLQIQTTTAPNVSIPANAGSSVSKGIELEFTARPTRDLTINSGVTYLDATYDADRIACALPAQAAPVVLAAGQAEPVNQCYRNANGTLQNLSGVRLPNAPRWRGNVSVRYDKDIAGTDYAGFVQLTGNAQTAVGFSFEQDQALRQSGYATIDASIGVHTQDDRYQLTVFVRNLTDKSYALGLQRDNIVTNAANPGNLLYFTAKEASRYAGATFRARF
ncbi:TonB-dependent receptor [Sphingomonas sp. LB3N6]|uniref:TonB-dependent receptor n=1 Tax=Sphingomonas fucosidasi TaxID=3096164 RepID=UPI002FC831EF